MHAVSTQHKGSAARIRTSAVIYLSIVARRVKLEVARPRRVSRAGRVQGRRAEEQRVREKGSRDAGEQERERGSSRRRAARVPYREWDTSNDGNRVENDRNEPPRGVSDDMPSALSVSARGTRGRPGRERELSANHDSCELGDWVCSAQEGCRGRSVVTATRWCWRERTRRRSARGF